MSDSESSTSESEPEETLISGRAKRSTAGNRLSHLLQHLDDEDVKADLLAEDETDQADYSDSGDEEGDVALESSDDDEDDDATKDGGVQALEGEQELRKEERVESRKKRKAREITKVQPLRKRVKIAEAPLDGSDVPAETAEVQPRKKLPATDHGPLRQSSRTQTVAVAKLTEIKVKESRKRAERTQEIMRVAAEKKAAEAGPALTQADRIARALEIEKENSQSLNRWEQSEQERLRLQKEKLEAMRNRKLEGPVIRYWSGPVTWQWRQGPDGPLYVKMKYKPNPSVMVEDIAKQDTKPVEGGMADKRSVDGDTTLLETATIAGAEVEMSSLTENAESGNVISQQAKPAHSDPVGDSTRDTKDVSMEDAPAFPAAEDLEQTSEAAEKPSVIEPMSFEDEIQYYATQNEIGRIQKAPSAKVEATSVSTTPNNDDTTSTSADQPYLQPAFTPTPSMPPYQYTPFSQEYLAAGTQAYPEPKLMPPPTTATLAASLPLLREKATRTLLILEEFPSLSPEPDFSTRRTSTSANPTNNSSTSALTQILLPDSHPHLTSEQRKYLASKHKKETAKERQDLLPAPPSKPSCSITGKVARFRDPKTGLLYRDVVAYKAIQRVLANGCQWSALLGVWSGIVGEGSLGRVARGVPEGFWTGKVEERKTSGEIEVVKIED